MEFENLKIYPPVKKHLIDLLNKYKDKEIEDLPEELKKELSKELNVEDLKVTNMSLLLLYITSGSHIQTETEQEKNFEIVELKETIRALNVNIKQLEEAKEKILDEQASDSIQVAILKKEAQEITANARVKSEGIKALGLTEVARINQEGKLIVTALGIAKDRKDITIEIDDLIKNGLTSLSQENKDRKLKQIEASIIDVEKEAE